MTISQHRDHDIWQAGNTYVSSGPSLYRSVVCRQVLQPDRMAWLKHLYLEP